jgi:hypothetical protein
VTLQTNRDLYLAVAKLVKENEDTPRSLEEYLRALQALGTKHREAAALSLDEFFSLLQQAFSSDASPFDERSRSEYENDTEDLQGYLGWRATILRQIVDLREMDEHGILQDKYRYLGTDSPRGQRWYNFDPLTFLECGTTGRFGGWREGDDTDRQYVPGLVVVQNDLGEFEEREPQDVPDPIYQIEAISWQVFREFLYSGQMYE